MKLVRFWFEFESSDLPMSPLCHGCGVTAWNYEDALNIVQDSIFQGKGMPAIVKCADNLDVSTLDRDHVLPNMNPANYRGVWFPLGYSLPHGTDS